VYAQHAQPTTVARISPSGYYCASADISGNVRVWDLAGTDQVLKLEIKALGGRITDLVWDGESKRIGVAGEGKDKFGHFFLIDSGSSCGEVTGHSKVTNGIAMKTSRPYRAVTAGDDGNIVFYNGVPFKYAKSLSTHKSFVQSVAYAPNGSSFASVGSDGKVFLYDGSTGDMQSSLTDGGDTAHKGTIFSCAFSPDSSQILTCGADGFLKVWEASGSLFKSFDLNGKNAVTTNSRSDDQLVGCTFAEGKEKAVAVSLAGEINIVDVKSGEITKLHGATKSISAASLVRSADGNLVAGELQTPEAETIRILTSMPSIPLCLHRLIRWTSTQLR
jgi:WD40 repeat protein